MNLAEPSPITLAITGASGAAYGLRLLEQLAQAGRQVYVLFSQAGELVVRMELGLPLPSGPREQEDFLCEHLRLPSERIRVFSRQQWLAPVASGSNTARAMVICPCTTGTLGAIAQGLGESLIHRAADVALKERKQLILVVRETPLSVIHLENMLKLSRMGATLLPACPGFYFQPQRIEDLVDFIVARVLDHLDIPHQLTPRWGASAGITPD